MNFYQLYDLLESEDQPRGNYHVRWIMRRDMPDMIRLAASHPEFSNMDKEDIQDRLLSALRNRDTVGFVAVNYGSHKESIDGMMIYVLNKSHILVPLITATNEEAYSALIDKMKHKISKSGHDRDAFYIRGHYDTNLLRNFPKHGMNAKPDGEYVTAIYHNNPAVTTSKNWGLPSWSKWERRPTNNLPPPPANAEDPYGLLKDKPWKDQPPETDEMV